MISLQYIRCNTFSNAIIYILCGCLFIEDMPICIDILPRLMYTIIICLKDLFTLGINFPYDAMLGGGYLLRVEGPHPHTDLNLMPVHVLPLAIVNILLAVFGSGYSHGCI